MKNSLWPALYKLFYIHTLRWRPHIIFTRSQGVSSSYLLLPMRRNTEAHRGQMTRLHLTGTEGKSQDSSPLLLEPTAQAFPTMPPQSPGTATASCSPLCVGLPVLCSHASVQGPSPVTPRRRCSLLPILQRRALRIREARSHS